MQVTDSLKPEIHRLTYIRSVSGDCIVLRNNAKHISGKLVGIVLFLETKLNIYQVS